MKLFDYLWLFKNDVDFDVPDSEIDTVITVCFSKENADKVSKDYPYIDKFTNLLLHSADVAYLLNDGTPVCNFSEIIHKNEELFKQFVKDEWTEDMQWVLEDEHGEFEYEFLKDFHLITTGNCSNKSAKLYYELLEKCNICGLS